MDVASGREVHRRSASQRIAHTIFSTSSATPELTAELPMLALTLTRKLRPIAIGSKSTWLMLAGIIARPRATSLSTNSGVTNSGISARKLRVGEARLGGLDRRLPGEVLPVGDIDHLFGDDPGAGEFELVTS